MVVKGRRTTLEGYLEGELEMVGAVAGRGFYSGPNTESLGRSPRCGVAGVTEQSQTGQAALPKGAVRIATALPTPCTPWAGKAGCAATGSSQQRYLGLGAGGSSAPNQVQARALCHAIARRLAGASA